MGQESIWRRPTKDDYEWPADATDAEIAKALMKFPPIRTTPPPAQGVGEFLNQATKSFQPSTIKEGLTRMVTDPIGMAGDLGQLPINLAGEGVDEFRQGNYARGGRKMFEAALPIAGGVAGLAAGGPAGIIPGYMLGAGVASGSDAATGYAEQGQNASAAGAAVDAGIQGALGVSAVRPRTAPNAAAMAGKLEQNVAGTTARTFGPTIGPDRYSWGNEARRLGPDIIRRTTGGSIDDISQQISSLREKANVSLDAAYDLIPTGVVSPGGAGPAGQGRVRLPLHEVKQGIRDRMNAYMTRDKAGNWIPFEGRAELVGALAKAYAELDNLPRTLDAQTVRALRQSWDKLAEYEQAPKSHVGWQQLHEQGAAYRIARDVLNDRTVETFPHLKPHIADAAFSIKADTLLKVLEETENARSRVGRRTAATGFGAVIGQGIGTGLGSPAAGAGLGALLGPAMEYFVSERLTPAIKIKAARTMTQLADELRQNGQSAKAMTYVQTLRQMAQPVGPTIRAAEAVQNRPQSQPPPLPPMVAPEQAAASGQSPTSWFDTVMQRGGG